MKNLMTRLVLATLILTLAACAAGTAESGAIELAADTPGEVEADAVADVAAAKGTQVALDPITVEYDHDDLDAGASRTGMATITLAGDIITVEGSGATVDGTVVTITAAGEYSISGVLNDGQIVVDTADAETVVLVLNGIDVTSVSSAPIYVKNAEKVVIALADGTVNFITNGDSYVVEDPASDEPNAAIFSHDDLTINGDGSLTVTANYNNGIASKDDLKITAGHITVNAVNDGIRGRDSIAVLAGTITVNAGGDGLQANNDEDPEAGYIVIEGGTLDITVGGDGLQAETRLAISGGDITVVSGGGSNSAVSADSAKGLKAGLDVTISDGTINLDAADDAVHSNDSITISGGDLLLATGDDGVHADATLAINGGHVNITTCYEGLESAAITVNDGIIHIVAGDDGINAVSDTGGGAMMGGPGMGGFGGGENNLAINGGYIAIDARGDGLDINGSVDMTAGTLLINGPTDNFNGPLDYNGAFNISGGLLVAVGSAGMAQAPGTSSSQYSVLVVFPSVQAAGTMVHVATEDGEEILTFVPTKAYQSLALSSPELENGATYVVYTGGSATGTVADSLYSGRSYSPGTEATRFTISTVVTAAGSATGGFMGGPGGMGGRGGMGGQRPAPP